MKNVENRKKKWKKCWFRQSICKPKTTIHLLNSIYYLGMIWKNRKIFQYCIKPDQICSTKLLTTRTALPAPLSMWGIHRTQRVPMITVGVAEEDLVPVNWTEETMSKYVLSSTLSPIPRRVPSTLPPLPPRLPCTLPPSPSVRNSVDPLNSPQSCQWRSWTLIPRNSIRTSKSDLNGETVKTTDTDDKVWTILGWKRWHHPYTELWFLYKLLYCGKDKSCHFLSCSFASLFPPFP